MEGVESLQEILMAVPFRNLQQVKITIEENMNNLIRFARRIINAKLAKRKTKENRQVGLGYTFPCDFCNEKIAIKDFIEHYQQRHGGGSKNNPLSSSTNGMHGLDSPIPRLTHYAEITDEICRHENI